MDGDHIVLLESSILKVVRRVSALHFQQNDRNAVPARVR
jgi:hypothetical protein